jgi:hypothetical protein
MADQLLATKLTVTALGAGASITIPHGLKSRGLGIVPTLILCDRASPIGVTIVTSTSVTFFNNGGVPETANFRVEYDHSIHATGTTPVYWQGFVGTGSGTTLYGSFSDTTDQPLTAGVPSTVKLNTTDLSNGITVVNDALGNPTRITVPANGIYSFDISPQLLHTGGGTVIITFWARIDGTNVPNSSSSLEMGNNNNRTLPFLQLDLQLNAGQYLEWVFLSTGTNTSLEHFPAVVGPPAVPAIPSVIVTAKRIST